MVLISIVLDYNVLWLKDRVYIRHMSSSESSAMHKFVRYCCM